MKPGTTLISELAAAGILRYGHFAFRTGRHSTALLDRDLLLADPALTSHFGYILAKRYFVDHVDTIVTPSIWGAGLAQWVGYFLEPKAKVVDATPRSDELTIAPVLEPLIHGKRVLLIDNLILSGQSMTQLLSVITDLGAIVVGIASLWSSNGASLGNQTVYAALNEYFPAWAPDDCPFCAEGAGPPELVHY